MTKKTKPASDVDFWVGLIATVGILIAMACMVYLFVSAP